VTVPVFVEAGPDGLPLREKTLEAVRKARLRAAIEKPPADPE